MEKKLEPQSEIPKKPSYEELNGYVNQLMIDNRNLRQKLSQIMDIQNKIPWLFEILKNKEFFDAKYIEAASREIKLIIPPYEESTEEKNTESENKD